ncbi:DUF1800 domain-containing protein [Vannielia litorea]|uniref:Uncharacterized conserved protein, DUF1800 family n=1 Tax=Vannielia litorea TaxID=1217970 RepID=A0A1N6GNL1_9RHOB|nr:DUF1800 domain-containing protein [Vannielia litorea]SIO09088.1 Uncharacterized conserved protein, DUF1800 family [Vannielia litorea]
MSFRPEIAAIRFGYGLSPRHAPPESPEAMVAALDAPDAMSAAWPIGSMEETRADFEYLRDLKQAERDGDETARKKYIDWRRSNREAHAQMLCHTVARALDAPDALRERLTRFWADHFTVVGRGVSHLMVQRFVQDAIRPHLTAPFGAMLKAAVTHPLMLIYLDQDKSIGPGSPVAARNAERGRRRGLNENLAREVLELHTLGVGGAYDQADVRQLAELLAGLTVNLREGMRFVPRQGEPGAEEVLGLRYGGKTPRLADIHAALDDIALHPDTAAHIARKLAVHFVSDTPPPALVEALRARYAETGGNLGAVMATLLRHPEAWGPLDKTKQPFDFLASALRALGLEGRHIADFTLQQARHVLLRPMQLMGQTWENPTGPDGWPEESSHWLTPQGLAVRINWSMSAERIKGLDLPDPRELLPTALADLGGPQLEFAARAAESRAEGVGIILASPAFQRR